jgi:excisionase family DNA binding protein
MNGHIVIEFCGEPLALTAEEFATARQRGRELLSEPSASVAAAVSPNLVTAKAVAQAMSLPTSTVYEGAKSGRIPCVRVGRHVRFDVAQVRAALGGSPVGHG